MGKLVIIMLSVKSGSGKDTFFELVKAHHTEKINVQRYSFADEVKKIALSIGWDGIKDSRGIELLQKISYAAREYDNEIWLRKINNTIQILKLRPFSSILIITDCRYENQIDYVKNLHKETYTVRIKRDSISNLTPQQKAHPIETSLDYYSKFDYHIINSSLESYKKQFLTLISSITNDKF
jgi:hypothetical protein